LIIIGIDPGTRVTGYGIIRCHCQNSSLEVLDYGCIRPSPKFKLTDRYYVIHQGIAELIERYSPDTLSIESQFVSMKNPRSALKLGMAAGAVIIAAKQKGLPVFEYAPTKVKSAVVGSGKASKHQVQCMVQNLLSLRCIPTPDDAADALALALCHAHSSQCPELQDQEI
jgi:crossover junction endodeoxyribonuclease RuvC